MICFAIVRRCGRSRKAAGFGDPVAGLRRGIALARVLDRYLRGVIVDLIHDEHQTGKTHFAGARIDLGAHLGLLTITERAAFCSASSIEAMTIDRSIDFSRATASAICKISSRLALTPLSRLLMANERTRWRQLAKLPLRLPS